MEQPTVGMDGSKAQQQAPIRGSLETQGSEIVRLCKAVEDLEGRLSDIACFNDPSKPIDESRVAEAGSAINNSICGHTKRIEDCVMRLHRIVCGLEI